ncbi:hypothetical protein LZ32DRAFT_641459 [Colletotrichum eremochloae]|nr:hypothetical protein LZ32DRAFT_641459 [Colletotrichum eremochloae]
MDPFNKLPAELRVTILVSTCCHHTIFQLIQASPVMLTQYTASKRYITKRLLSSDFDDSMVQDAMAIILFPPQTTRHFQTLARAHCRSWASQQFANPLRQPLPSQEQQDYINKISKLHRGLIFFIEDYLTKATAVFPPREYLCLPSGAQLVFKGQSISPRFNAANLKNPERKRLLQAFLRYQLYCLLSRVENYEFEVFTKIASRVQELQPWDKEAILCVHTYLISLYGAMAVQCSNDAWLPEVVPRATSPPPPGLLYPDSLYFDPDAYPSILKRFRDKAHLASLGFDLVASFLRSATAGQLGRDRLKKWLSDFDVKEKDHQSGPGMCRVLLPQLCPLDIQRKIYQQRAWVFLDDARLYPSPSPDAKPHFPTEDDILNEQFDNTKQDEDWFTYPHQTQARHRSLKPKIFKT